jgi:hypothetical protein
VKRQEDREISAGKDQETMQAIGSPETLREQPVVDDAINGQAGRQKESQPQGEPTEPKRHGFETKSLAWRREGLLPEKSGRLLMHFDARTDAKLYL